MEQMDSCQRGGGRDGLDERLANPLAKGLAKEHVCRTHRYRQQCGDDQREVGSRDLVDVGKGGEIGISVIVLKRIKKKKIFLKKCKFYILGPITTLPLSLVLNHHCSLYSKAVVVSNRNTSDSCPPSPRSLKWVKEKILMRDGGRGVRGEKEGDTAGIEWPPRN